MKVGSFEKQPGERISVSIGYAYALDDGDEVSLVNSCVVSPDGEMTASAVLAATDRVRVWVEGGLDRVAYTVTVTVTTAGGERLEDELTCKVKEI
jgi:hypothetical protein